METGLGKLALFLSAALRKTSKKRQTKIKPLVVATFVPGARRNLVGIATSRLSTSLPRRRAHPGNSRRALATSLARTLVTVACAQRPRFC